MDRIDDIIAIVIVVGSWIIQMIRAAQKKRQEQQPQPAPQQTQPEPRPQPPRPRPSPRPAPTPSSGAPRPPRPAPATPAGPSPALLAALRDLEARGDALAADLEDDRSTFRLAEPLRAFTARQLEARRRAAAAGEQDARLMASLGLLDVIYAEVTEMAEERRDPELAAALGDADALAAACYAPVITWARAENLPLAAAEPVTRWGDYPLSVWTGFQLSGIAPIYLPDDFFERVAWWPAVAHEIAHSFLASSRGLDAALRDTLGLPSEQVGRRPLVLEGDGITRRELRRVMGGWFEEIFADVFGTLMLGEAYVRTMQHHFGADGDPREVLAATREPGTNLYGVHPPAQVRVMVGSRTLALAGQSEAADRLMRAWDERHTQGGEAPDRLLFPMGDGYLALPLGPFAELVDELVERLVAGPLPPLAGHGLADLGGLGYGPHAAAEAGRARDALLRGHPPRVRDARAVIAGAVLAWSERPELEAAILAAARAAIPALGSGERRPDAYDLAPAPAGLSAPPRRPGQPAPATPRAGASPLALDPAAVRDAMVLSAVLTRPAARARRRS